MALQIGGANGQSGQELRGALLVSLLLHLVVIWQAAPQDLSRDGTETSVLSATLLPATPDLAAPTIPRLLPASPALPKASPLQRLVPTENATGARPVESASAVVATGVSAMPSESVPRDEGNFPASAIAAPQEGLRAYKIALASQARRFKRYPAQATGAGWAGRVDIRLAIDGGGRALAAVLVRSSGYEALDQAALAMIDAGAARVRVPESLAGQAFDVVLPVVFDLNEQ